MKMNRNPVSRRHQIVVLVTLALVCSSVSLHAQSDTKGTQGGEPTVCRININEATPEQLQLLPGVGPAIAGRIVEARPIASVDDLLAVRGIGEKTMQKLRPLVTVAGETLTGGCPQKRSRRQAQNAI